MSTESSRTAERVGGGIARRTRGGSPGLERLLTKAEAAEALSVSVRFVVERRIRYVKLGKFVRIPEGGVADFIEAGDMPARW